MISVIKNTGPQANRKRKAQEVIMEITKQKLIQYAKHPGKIVLWFGRRGWLPFVSDEAFIKLQFKERFGYPLDLKYPRTFNEKLLWLMLYDRRPEYTRLADKYAVKKWVADRIGEEYIIPTLGVWEHFDDIDFDALPDQFVLKCTHDSGSIVIVRDKAKLDRAAAKKKLERALRRNYYIGAREWQYKDIPPRIIAEKYMTDESGVELKDYKVFCFNGEPKLIQVDYGRFTNHKRNLYTTDWQYVKGAINYPTDPDHPIKRPTQLEKMLTLAHTLSAGFPQVRVDFYSIEDHIYFGELTFTHEAGLARFDPESLAVEMGGWIKLPTSGGGYPDWTLEDCPFFAYDGSQACAFV